MTILEAPCEELHEEPNFERIGQVAKKLRQFEEKGCEYQFQLTRVVAEWLCVEERGIPVRADRERVPKLAPKNSEDPERNVCVCGARAFDSKREIWASVK